MGIAPMFLAWHRPYQRRPRRKKKARTSYLIIEQGKGKQGKGPATRRKGKAGAVVAGVEVRNQEQNGVRHRCQFHTHGTQRARDSGRNQVPVLVEERQSAGPPYLSVCRIKGKRKARKRGLAATPQDTSSLNCRQRAGQAVQRHSTGHRKKECAKRPRIWRGERSTSRWPALCSPSIGSIRLRSQSQTISLQFITDREEPR